MPTWTHSAVVSNMRFETTANNLSGPLDSKSYSVLPLLHMTSKQQTATLTIGLPASGKSTWAKEQVTNSKGRIKRINNDDIRIMLGNKTWSGAVEKSVGESRNALINAFLLNGYDIIVDNTHLNPSTLLKLMNEIRTAFPNVKVEIKDFTDVSVEECLKRDAARTNSVGSDVILKMWYDYVVPTIPEPVHVPGAPFAVICDLDGTLARMTNRGPFDESKVYDDAVIQHVELTVRALLVSHKAVGLFTSARTKGCFDDTKKYLMYKAGFDMNPEFGQLFMREVGDNRDDTIVKRELYESNIKGKYNVIAVFDDRPKVVRLWHSLRLPVFNCGQSINF